MSDEENESQVKDTRQGEDEKRGEARRRGAKAFCGPDSNLTILKLNILVSSSYRATITDFGSARLRRKPSKVRRKASQDTAPIPTAKEYATSAPINLVTTGDQLNLTGPAWSLRWAAPEIVLEDDVYLPSDFWAA
ncbi:hypothetical protein FRC00_003679, partial [Tulasnella sp. 408]